MCRLYTFRSNNERKVECELIRSQNSLLSQSRADTRGNSNPDGWGLGTYERSVASVVRQPEPAYESEEFRWEAGRVFTCNALAHVRRATVGGVEIENTHPFTDDNWLFAHNGTLDAFKTFRPRLLSLLPHKIRQKIKGETDSEHVFSYLLFLRGSQPDAPLSAIVRTAALQIIQWTEDADPGAEAALNIILTDGKETVGLRYGRSLYYVKRNLVHPCEVCDGALHVKEGMTSPYCAAVVASEPVTRTEEWIEVQNATIFTIDQSVSLHFESM